MLLLTEDEAHGCILLESSGALTRRDLDRLDRRVGEQVAAGRRPNLLIRAEGFPTWTDLATLTGHIRFIRRRHRAIGRVALVSDAKGMVAAPRLGHWLVSAEVRRFPADALDDALRWLAEAGDAVLLDGLPPGVVGLSLRAPIDATMAERLLTPALGARPCGLLLRVERGFRLQDAAIGPLPALPPRVTRVAILAEGTGFRRAVALLRPFLPMPVSVFGLSERDTAVAWLTQAAP